VPETIQAMLAADIRVWILTGDKMETAISIAQSSGLCNRSTRLFVIDKSGPKAVISKLRDFNEAVNLNISFELKFLGPAVSIGQH
jgi:magnesium-transporting ATPase (P-type)